MIRGPLRAATAGLPRAFWVLCAGMFVNRCGAFVLPFLAIYLTQGRHLSVATAGMVASVYGAGAMVASPLGGYLADHIGRRRTLVGALLLGGSGMAALGFASRLEWIVPGVFVVAVMGESYRPAMQAAVADLVPPADRVRAYGLLYWVINLGFSVGVSLGGLLASKAFLYLFLGDGLTSVAFGLLALRLVPETHPAHAAGGPRPAAPGMVRGFLAPYRDRPFLGFIVLSIAILLVFMQNVTALPLDMAASGIPRASLGLVLAINGVLIVLVQPLLAPRLARASRAAVLAAGTALVGTGFGLNAFADRTAMFALASVVWTIGEIALLPTANALVADVAPPDLRGRYQGAYGLCWGIATFAAPVVGTGVMQRFGAHVLWLGCLVVGVLVAAGHRALGPRLARLAASRLSRPHTA